MFMKILGWIGGLLFVAFFGVVVVCLVTDGYLSIRYGVGIVKEGRHSTFIKEFLEEKEGCIYFIDVYGDPGKSCGTYTAIKRK